MDKAQKTFKAIVYDEEKCFGRRIELKACDIDEAMRKLNSEYGEGNYIDLHNEDSANRPR